VSDESETPKHKEMPLTLAFTPEHKSFNTPESWTGTVIVQPSAEEPGCIFTSIQPTGQPMGVHLSPDEARLVRDHLSKLLLEPEEPQEAESVQQRVERAVQRRKAQALAERGIDAATPEQKLARVVGNARVTPSRLTRLRRQIPRPRFKLEFKWGALEAIIARIPKDD
jgi:hypothetical protein